MGFATDAAHDRRKIRAGQAQIAPGRAADEELGFVEPIFRGLVATDANFDPDDLIVRRRRSGLRYSRGHRRASGSVPVGSASVRAHFGRGPIGTKIAREHKPD